MKKKRKKSCLCLRHEGQGGRGDRGSDIHRWAEEQTSGSDCPGTSSPPPRPSNLAWSQTCISVCLLTSTSQLLPVCWSHNHNNLPPCSPTPRQGLCFSPSCMQGLCNMSVFLSVFLANWHGVSSRTCFLKGVQMTWGPTTPPVDPWDWRLTRGPSLCVLPLRRRHVMTRSNYSTCPLWHFQGEILILSLCFQNEPWHVDNGWNCPVGSRWMGCIVLLPLLNDLIQWIKGFFCGATKLSVEWKQHQRPIIPCLYTAICLYLIVVIGIRDNNL